MTSELSTQPSVEGSRTTEDDDSGDPDDDDGGSGPDDDDGGSGPDDEDDCSDKDDWPVGNSECLNCVYSSVFPLVFFSMYG